MDCFPQTSVLQGCLPEVPLLLFFFHSVQEPPSSGPRSLSSIPYNNSSSRLSHALDRYPTRIHLQNLSTRHPVKTDRLYKQRKLWVGYSTDVQPSVTSPTGTVWVRIFGRGLEVDGVTDPCAYE